MTPHEPELWIVVRNWRKFQHYKDRNPSWVKNYTQLMSDDNYLSLTPHACAVLHRLWLEYARSGCQLRADTLSLTRRLGLRVTKSHLESLNHAGFIEFSASKMVRPSRARRETELKQSQKPASQSEVQYADDFESFAEIIGRQAGPVENIEEEPWN